MGTMQQQQQHPHPRDGCERSLDSSASFAPSIELRFPVICFQPFHDNYQSDCAASVMAPPSEGQSDDTGSSLGDSAYEILGDSTVLTSSDDEDRDDVTDSVSSVGVHGPDDVNSVAGTEQSEDSSSADSQLETADVAPVHQLGFGPPGAVDDSGVTIREYDRAADAILEFEEPSSPESETVTVVHTVETFDDAQRTEILRHLRTDDPPASLAATVRQAMSREVVSIEGPFRLLYVGSTSAEEDIVGKLAASLAVSVMAGSKGTAVRRRSSRFNVVPISSFGDRGSPEVELVGSFGLELVVDECTAARTTKVEGKPDTLDLQLNGTSWCRSRGSDTGVVDEADAPWTLPHLAVIFCSDADDIATRQTRLYARCFMARHGVPTVVISQSPLYERPTENYALDPRTLHACLESRGSSPSSARILKRLPVDLGTFLSVEARQMNRNLACLTGLHADRPTSTVAQRRQPSNPPRAMATPEDVEKFSRRTVDAGPGLGMSRRRIRQGRRALVLLGVLLVCALVGTSSTLLYHKFGFNSLPLYPGGDGRSGSMFSFNPSGASPLPNASISRSMSTPTGAVASSTARYSSLHKAPSTNLAVADSRKDLARLLVDPTLTALNHSDQFKIQVVGDSHIILRPPKKLAGKRPLSLSVKISRNGQPLEADLSRLFEGVYALKLRREDAWGLVNVTVSTRSKPHLEQTLIADFGTPWLKITEWRRAAEDVSKQLRDNLKRAQTSFQQSLDWMNNDLPTVLGQPIHRAGHAAQLALRLQAYPSTVVVSTARRISNEARKRRAALTDGFNSVNREVSRLVSRQSRNVAQAGTALRQLTDQIHEARIRASKTFTIPRARKQAGRVWRRMWEQNAKDGRHAARRGQRKTCGRRESSCKGCRR